MPRGVVKSSDTSLGQETCADLDALDTGSQIQLLRGFQNGMSRNSCFCVSRDVKKGVCQNL